MAVDGWPGGGGELSGLVRHFDWSRTSLGALDEWPQSLRTAVNLILRSPVPMIVLWNPEGVMIYNDGYAEIAGGRHPELLGGRVLEGWPEIADFNRRVMETGLSGGTLTFKDQHLVLLRNGEPEDVWFDLYYSPVPGDDGPPQGVLAVVVETTKRILAEQERAAAEEARRASEERFRAAFAHSTIGVAFADLDGRFLDANRTFCEITGYSADELRERSIHSITHPDDRERNAEMIAQMLSGKVPAYVIEKRYLRPDGNLLWVQNSVSMALKENGEPAHLISLSEEITERKKAEQALLRSNEELQGFVYAASHDLREPLRTIASYTQLLARQYSGNFDERAQEYMQHVVTAAKRMDALINDLTAYARAGRLEGVPMQPVDLQEIVEAAKADLRAAIDETNATVTVEQLPMIHGNAQQLDQLVQNLIGNAIKYNRPGVPPEIRIFAELQGDEWRITVKDNGLGFPEERASKIFEIFKRLHGREIPGTGIGLAICKRVVERHGGRIWAESVPEQGSEFHFTLPC